MTGVAGAGPAGAVVGLAGRRVLVVEDEMLPALEMELAIEDAGGTPLGPIDTLARGLAFLDGAEGERIDVAILDVNLHGVEVFPLAERLQERGVPFLFHTGHGSREELKDRFPDAPLCSKPVQVEVLLAEAARLAAG